jgi:predicted nucleotidyltransferase
VVGALSPVTLGIFGSYAIGMARGRSDLDLFVILETNERRAARMRAVHRLLFGTLYRIDAQVFTPREFEETAYEFQSFTWVVARQARLYHWAQGAEAVVPSLLPRLSASQMYLCRSSRAGSLCSQSSFVASAD